VAAKLYLDYHNGDEKIEEEALWSTLFALLAMFVISVTAFFTLIDRNYLHTFTTTMTAPQYCVSFFREATTDEQRIDVFTQHPTYYSSIENEVVAFVGDNWNTWQAERPDWFTEAVISTIDDRFIAAAELAKLNIAAGGQRRRNSFAGLGEGRRRSSLGSEGRASVAPTPD
jgi:hypothetical protein